MSNGVVRGGGVDAERRLEEPGGAEEPAPAGSSGGPVGPSSGRVPASIADRLSALRLPRFGGLFLLAGLVIVFGILMPNTFLTTQTATSIARGQSIILILALSLMVCLSAGAFDLSVGANVGFGAVLCISLMATHGWSPLVASVATVVACAAVGALNAVLVAGVGMDSFIATLGVSSVLTAMTLMVSSGLIVGPAPAGFQQIAAWQPAGVPVLIIYALALSVLAWYVLEYTPLGRRLQATGANRAAAALAGIDTGRYIAGALVVCGLGAGLAAVLLSASVGSISPSAGATYLLPVFAGCFLATTQVRPGRYNVPGLLISLFLLGTGVKGFSLLGGKVWIPDLFNGLALLAAVGLTVFLHKRSLRRAKARLSPVGGGADTDE